MSWVQNNEWLKPNGSYKIEWAEILRFARNYSTFNRHLLLAGALALGGSIALIFIPAVFRSIQAAIPESDLVLVAWSLAAFLGIGLLEAAATFSIGIISAQVSTRLNCILLLEYYQKLLNASVPEFIEFRQRTNLFQRIIDAMSVTQQFTAILIRGGQAVIIVIVVGGIIAYLSISAFAVVAVGSLCLAVFVYSQAARLKELRQRSLSFNYPLVSRMTEIIRGIFVIKALSASLKVSSDVAALVQRKREAELSENSRSVLSAQLSQGIKVTTLTAAIAVSIFQLWAGNISIAELIALYVLINLFLNPVAELAGLYQSLASLSANVKNYYEVIDLRSESPALNSSASISQGANEYAGLETANGESVSSAVWAHNPDGSPTSLERQGRIVFRNVSFGYQSNVDVLKGLTFDVAPGEHISLIGKSGAGKTTLFRLLVGFLEPHEGSIHVDGIDVANVLDKSEFRKLFGVVSQSDFLFETSIRENLSFGLNDLIDDEKINEVLESVGLSNDLNRLPQRYETVYSDGMFSGGQRQRLLIARALLRNPKIVLLDEPTSALDFKTESQVISAINRLAGNRTTLTIAHRLSTIMSASRVVVLKDGRIEAMGPHVELYECSEYYRQLCDFNSFVL